MRTVTPDADLKVRLINGMQSLETRLLACHEWVNCTESQMVEAVKNLNSLKYVREKAETKPSIGHLNVWW